MNAKMLPGQHTIPSAVFSVAPRSEPITESNKIELFSTKMNRSAWKQPISAEAAYRRAGGRRAYNARRFDVAHTRRRSLAKMLGGYAPTRGELASVAYRLGVSKATASRDVATLRRLGVLQERMTFKRLMQQYKQVLKNVDFS